MRTTAVYLAASVLARLGAFLLVPLYTRRFSETEYGNFVLLQTVVTLWALVSSMGFGPPMVRRFFERRTREEGLIAAGEIAAWSVALTVSLTTGALIALHFFRDRVAFIPPRALGYAVLAGALSATSAIPESLLRASQRPMRVVALQLGQFLTTTLLGVLFVQVLGRGLYGALEATVLGVTPGALFGFWFMVKRLGGLRFCREALGSALLFSLPLLPQQFAAWALTGFDRWVLNRAGLKGDVARLAIASLLLTPALLVVSAWNDAQSAAMGELHRAEGVRGVRARHRQFVRGYVLALLLPSAALLLSYPILTWAVGEKFKASLDLIPLLWIGTVFEAVYFPFSNMSYFAGRTRGLFLTTLAALGVNVGMNLALVPFFGVYGTVAARIGGSAVRALLAAWVALPRNGPPSREVNQGSAPLSA